MKKIYNAIHNNAFQILSPTVVNAADRGKRLMTSNLDQMLRLGDYKLDRQLLIDQ